MPPYAPSTCIQSPCSAHTSAISFSGSIAPVETEPAVAMTAMGCIPFRTSRAMADRSASVRMRRGEHCRIRRTPSPMWESVMW